MEQIKEDTLGAGAFRSPLMAGTACGIGAGAMWGLVFLAPEVAGPFGPLALAIGRYISYGSISLLLIAPHWARLRRDVSRDHWATLFWLALTGNTLYYMLLSSAVQMGGIAMTSIVIGFLPVTVTIIGSRDRGAVSLRQLAPSLLLCTAGTLAIGWQAIMTPSTTPISIRVGGLLCAVGALMSWTFFAVKNSRALARVRNLSAQDWNLLTGIMTGAQTLFLIPLALFFESADHSLDAWTLFAIISIGIAGLASILGNSLWNRMSRLLPLTLVGQMILFETLFALLYGFLWERRLPTTLEILAFFCVVSSVISCLSAHRQSRS